ncbi:UbiA-like protein EboC [Romeria aff. gracilis LEGE 07310]|uniref:UbiA-like protein EboC n=1 Tax=Vasconcelosia minhoensis LEGE 07310 TaxID=915328 RepID=A0A8J7DCC8_9CYAN|nr:UbiA-like protein EboC [Romeria gracilis]MBE9077528.1 UbiA-like protein EboC [Romeria aff. gracilis LEGE 07310]
MSTATAASKTWIRTSASIRAYLQLMRPANIVTAWADILAGYSATGLVMSEQTWPPLLWLLLATTGLYAGGVVFNDVFDAELDAVERPERPIPSGQSSLKGAIGLGIALLGLGIGAAAQVSELSLGLAIVIAIAALLYDRFSKHHSLIGPINMGLCRGCNLLLGVSAVAEQTQMLWFLALIPLAYIGAITAISQGEVAGGQQRTGVIALLLLSMVTGALFGLSFLPSVQGWNLLPFTLLLIGLVFPPFLQAADTPNADMIRAAVKAGILALIVLDASLAAGFAGWPYGLVVLSLLPGSKGISRLFAMT